ncbi:MAG: ATP-dependent Clp protease ATP-binding subunit ClpX [Myxococcota bacterium]|nr:ATP-dependent Clp protease ATP-binding subunit ClpX [Myxococcota bacterium]
MAKQYRNSGLRCSFCHKTQQEDGKLKIIAGPQNVFICSDCVRLCLEIIRENTQNKTLQWRHNSVPPPVQIKAHLDQYVVGQEAAKRKIAVAVYNHYKRLEVNEESKREEDVEIQKSNLLLIGPTGTGKTLLAQTLARFLDVPFVIADATTLTEAGYVGEDVENIILKLYKASGNSIEQTKRGIVYVDEIDKLAKKGSTSSVSRDVSGEGVQQALLKIIEGSNATLQLRGNNRLPSQENIQIDTTNILFICGGSFEGLEKVVEARLGKRSLGFLNKDEGEKKEETRNLLAKATPEDLEKFGLIPEFIGRLPVLATMNALSEEHLVKILQEPKNSLIKQYQKLFKFEKVSLTFTEEALRAIAQKSTKRKAGARGLRTIIEAVMLDIMYEMPSLDNLQSVTIDVDTINEGAEPKMVFKNNYGVPS